MENNWIEKKYDGDIYPTYINEEIGFTVYNVLNMDPTDQEKHFNSISTNWNSKNCWGFFPIKGSSELVYSNGYSSLDKAKKEASIWFNLVKTEENNQ